jgi:hypothetical protein
MSKNSWIDDDWSRDWLFWVGVATAALGVVLSIAYTDASAWALVLGGAGLFAFTVATAGFVRTAYRAFRDG